MNKHARNHLYKNTSTMYEYLVRDFGAVIAIILYFSFDFTTVCVYPYDAKASFGIHSFYYDYYYNLISYLISHECFADVRVSHQPFT